MPESSSRQIFISHIADEHPEALRAKEILEKSFGNAVEVFLASSWDSIAPGDDWFERIEQAIKDADLMLVLASSESVLRPWILFETGAAWFSKKRVIPLCHKVMTPNALPEPIRRLQAVDINGETPGEGLSIGKLVDSSKIVTGLAPAPAAALEELPIPASGGSSLRGWMLRPAAHVGETSEGSFKVGEVDNCDAARARAAEVDPDEALFVRLYVEPQSGRLSYVNAIAAGKAAEFFEQETVTGKTVRARIKLAATHQVQGPEPKSVPIVVVESVRFAGEGTPRASTASTQ